MNKKGGNSGCGFVVNCVAYATKIVCGNDNRLSVTTDYQPVVVTTDYQPVVVTTDYQ